MDEIKNVDTRLCATGEGSSSGGFSNRLAQEASPYLLQHAKNPVDWYPWGEEAFEKARKEQKPIFLSIGYSTCHWCHVMEHESFEDEATAELLNRYFVAIKVDKEERPDVDRVYMSYVQASSGHGGWPMSVFLTPDLKPFFGGTYFPKEAKYGLLSFKELLTQVYTMWNNKQKTIMEHSESTMDELSKALNKQKTSDMDSDLQEFTIQTLMNSTRQLKTAFDPVHGGFSRAPKFPRPSEIHALLAEYHRLQNEDSELAQELLKMIEFTLEKMSNGGIYDHIGGGFHRYSVDELWHVPHFEKMLYDNAQLAVTYLKLHQLTKEPKWAKVASGILSYLTRDLIDPKGGVYSAEDADSLDNSTGKKLEGAFYVWTANELRSVLDRVEYDVFSNYYQVKDEGNCTMSERSDPHGEFLGKNCLFAAPDALKKMVENQNQSVEDVEKVLKICREKVLNQRSLRRRPHLDNKIVTAWNGMSMLAFAKASHVLKSASSKNNPSSNNYLIQATKIADFLREYLWDDDKQTLKRSYCAGKANVDGFADDYVWTIAGLLELYKHSAEVKWLKWAIQLQDRMDELFYDFDNGGYFATKGNDPNLLLRLKEDYDSAEPTASSIGLGNLVQLAILVSKNAEMYMEKARQTIQCFNQRVKKIPIAMPQFVAAMYLCTLLPNAMKVVICGSVKDEKTQDLINVVHEVDRHGTGLIIVDLDDQDGLMFWKEHSSENLRVLGDLIDLKEPGEDPVVKKKPLQGTAYVCVNFTCKAPTSDPETLRMQITAAQKPLKTEFNIDSLVKRQVASSAHLLRFRSSFDSSQSLPSLGSTRLETGLITRRSGSLVARAAKVQSTKSRKSANRLIKEQSPELTRYARSEIAWYPWGDDAFKKAKSEQKVILLSIGFSSGHWCHLMEKESFEDPDTAKFVNENFIPVKVDREERPDLDRWCTTFIYLTLGKTGWPITMFLTPELAPIFGTTYLPNVEKFGLPDFKTILVDMVHEWNTDKEKIIVESRNSVEQMVKTFNQEPLPFEQGLSTGITLVDELMNGCSNSLIQDYDEDYGGFGDNEKFPSTSYLHLIMRQFQRKIETTKTDAVEYLMKMAICTLGAMHDGGIRDHIGGGFHRYTIDRIWHVPEFEKMLIDNAQITNIYLTAAQLFPDENWTEVIRSTLDCLKRDFLASSGGFYSSIDSHSVTSENESKEGVYYTWNASEVKSILTEEEYRVFSKYYSIMDDGNCNLSKSKDDDPVFTNVLVINEFWKDAAKAAGLKKSEFFRLIATCRKKLYEAKVQNRSPPNRDEKIICGWNGTVISAFALASRILVHEKQPKTTEEFPIDGSAPQTYLNIAIQTAEFLIKRLWDEENSKLFRYYYDGRQSAIEAYAEDYAQVIAGFLDLYSCSGDFKWLKWSIRLQSKMDELFWDDKYGGYFSSTSDNQSLGIRTKMHFDTEEPTASSIAVSNLLRLSGLESGGAHLREKAKNIIESFAGFAQSKEIAIAEMAASSCLIDLHPSLIKVIIIGDKEDKKSQKFLNTMHASYTPGKSLVFMDPSDKKCMDLWKEIAPDIVERHEKYWDPKKAKEAELEGEFQFPLLFISENYELSGPYDDPEALLDFMKTE
eukprot:g5646.t1